MPPLLENRMDFGLFKRAVQKQFHRMSTLPLFRVGIDKDILWETYLKSFPEGTNNVFRKRQEYDCSCCRHFIKNIGDVVSMDEGGNIMSIWDIDDPVDDGFAVVASALSKLIHAQKIVGIFLSPTRFVGVEKTFENMVDHVHTWEHFYVQVPNVYVRNAKDIPTLLGEARASHDVMLRSLSEITTDAVGTVIELIDQNAIYRGAEFSTAVDKFRHIKKQWDTLDEEKKDRFAWLQAHKGNNVITRMRNTAIGTLLVDLSNGVDLERAVKSFETIMAPSNYKRPTALVTTAMIEKAKETLTDLGLMSAIQRRFATIDDIDIRNVIFMDRSSDVPNKDVFDEIAGTVSDKGKKLSRVDEVPITVFLQDWVPHATSIEIMPEGMHKGNFVSIIAPDDPTAAPLFKWNNPFSWSYAGEAADSIKEKVKAMGGCINADVRVSLHWFNKDDEDLRVTEPDGHIIFYADKKNPKTGGTLDVDMNVNDPVRGAVENIFYRTRRTMPHGTYRVEVNNYNKREYTEEGFEVEIEVMGVVQKLSYDRSVRNGETVHVADIVVSNKGIEVHPNLKAESIMQDVWGISTNKFHRVTSIMKSPNYWGDNHVGNAHTFFIIDGCVNDGKARGFYNEFLRGDLDKHRKVLEMVGSRVPVREVPGQLSGLGFSSTMTASVLCRVTGKTTRVIKVLF